MKYDYPFLPNPLDKVKLMFRIEVIKKKEKGRKEMSKAMSIPELTQPRERDLPRSYGRTNDWLMSRKARHLLRRVLA